MMRDQEKQTPHLREFLVAGRVEAGVDEAGRGCLAGPVVAAAVILPPGFCHPLLNDSKQLSEKHRNLLRGIIESSALAWATGMASPAEIDDINILQASFLAMNRAITQLGILPGHLIIDGNRFLNRTTIPHTCLIRGDATFLAIAAASVIAKTHRDELMLHLHKELPDYHWNKNKGYPTTEHRNAIAHFGISPYHRKTFRLTNEQLSLWKTP